MLNVLIVVCMVLILAVCIFRSNVKTNVQLDKENGSGIHEERHKKPIPLSSEWASCLNETCMKPSTTLTETAVTISVLTHGKSVALVTDLLKNLVHYTNSDTLIVVHHNPFDSALHVTVRQLYQRYGNTSKLVFNPCSFNSRARFSYILAGHMANYMLLNVHGISTKYLLMLPHNARLFRWGRALAKLLETQSIGLQRSHMVSESVEG